MYRSGDRGRRLPDGALEFLGRMDRQIKVRGFRIELGEVEAALRSHPDVLDAAVVTHTDAAQGVTLVAHYATEPDSVVSGEDLRAFASERLPEYMIPRHIIRLDRLPMTPNGKVDTKALAAMPIQPYIVPNLPLSSSDKVDRQALSHPALASAQTQETYVAPRSALERVIASVWASVLGLPRVSVDQNFFDLGGHSLLASQAMARINAAIESSLTVDMLFEAGTVAELAAAILKRQVIQADTGTVLELLEEVEGQWLTETEQGSSMNESDE
jgi:hypothetical protein